MRLLAIAIALLASGFALAAEKTPQQQFPPGTKMMPARTVNLTLDAERYAEIPFPERPCVVDDLVNLIPGEKILLEAEVQGDALVNLNWIEKAVHPKRTLEIEFKQNQENRAAAFMMLVVKNPFDRDLTYEAAIQRHGDQKFYKTSTIPVQAGLVTYESWPEPLTRILLKNFRLGAKGAPAKPATGK